MSFFEDVKSVLTKTAKDAAKVSGEVTQQAKLRLKATHIKSEIESCYTRIGELYYGAVECEQDNGEKISSTMEEIKALKEELEELEEKISKNKGVKKCSVCDAVNDSEASYCSKCGSSLN